VTSRKYSDEEAQEILARALEKQGIDASKTSHEDLRRAAEEVGITGEEFDAAAAEMSEGGEQRRLSKDYRAWLRRRRRGWFRHLAVYLAVCAFLVAIDLFTSQFGAIHWSFFPIAGWGLGVVLHLLGVVFSKDEEEWTARELRRREWKRRWRDGKRKFDRGSKAFEQIVTAGVEALMKSIDDQQRARLRVDAGAQTPRRRVEGDELLEDDVSSETKRRSRS